MKKFKNKNKKIKGVGEVCPAGKYCYLNNKYINFMFHILIPFSMELLNESAQSALNEVIATLKA